MTTLMLSFFLAANPCHVTAATAVNIDTIITTMDDDTGGDTEHLPTDPPPHPHSIPWPWLP